MKKNIYKLLDEATEQYVPNNFDSIMAEIKKMPMNETLSETHKFLFKKKNRPALRYLVMSSAAACLVIVFFMYEIKQNSRTTPPSVENSSVAAKLTEQMENIETHEDEKIQANSQNNDQTNASDAQKLPENNFFIPSFIVCDYDLYRIVDNSIGDEDLNEASNAMINGKWQTIYSLKGQSRDTCVVLKTGYIYCCYERIYRGVFTFKNREYGLKIQFSDETKKRGKYLGEADGFKIYECVGNSETVLVDMSPITNTASENDEQLYVAVLINN